MSVRNPFGKFRSSLSLGNTFSPADGQSSLCHCMKSTTSALVAGVTAGITCCLLYRLLERSFASVSPSKEDKQEPSRRQPSRRSLQALPAAPPSDDAAAAEVVRAVAEYVDGAPARFEPDRCFCLCRAHVSEGQRVAGTPAPTPQPVPIPCARQRGTRRTRTA
eukprot:1241836-Prymnesium_polylepis.2